MNAMEAMLIFDTIVLFVFIFCVVFEIVLVRFERRTQFQVGYRSRKLTVLRISGRKG